jgi:hypothetical protein
MRWLLAFIFVSFYFSVASAKYEDYEGLKGCTAALDAYYEIENAVSTTDGGTLNLNVLYNPRIQWIDETTFRMHTSRTGGDNEHQIYTDEGNFEIKKRSCRTGTENAMAKLKDILTTRVLSDTARAYISDPVQRKKIIDACSKNPMMKKYFESYFSRSGGGSSTPSGDKTAG